MASNRNQVGTSTSSLMFSSPFLGGLNTELPGIVDSTDFTKEELNMLIRPDGARSRRPGVDYEENFKFSNELADTTLQNLAINCIEWLDVNSPDESTTYDQIPYIVVQIGSTLTFFRNHGQPYSQDEAEFSLDLTQYKLDGRSNEDVATERCKFTVAYGCLFITSKAIKPIRLRSAMEDPEVPLVITYPYCTVSCSAFRGKHQRMGSCVKSELAYCEFYFNDLLIGKYEVPRGVGDQKYNPFPNSYTLAEYFNSIDAAVRRNITAVPFETAPGTWTNPDEGWPSWSPADWITFNAASSTERGLKITIKVFGWAYKSSGWREHTNTYQAYMAGGSSDYSQSTGLTLQIRDTSVGAKDFLTIDENPTLMSYAHLYNLLNQGWTTKLLADFYVKSHPSGEYLLRFFPGNNLAQQYLKDKKTDPFKPEDLVNMTFGNTPAARGHIVMDFFEQDRLSLANLVTSMSQLVSEINTALSDAGETGHDVTVDSIRDKLGSEEDTEQGIAEDQVPVVKPRRDYVVDTLAYAGRIFYLCGDVLLYSQMISEDVSRADKCYTAADPTSEEISDVVETDGGLISLPDIGEGIKLAQYGQYLFVFGTRGNAAITGTANNIFTATAYSAGSLGAAPTQAPYSFVDTEYGVFYWGTTAIYHLGMGEGGLSANDLSTAKILTWFGKLSNTQHEWCKGVYSAAKKKVYWFYPTDDNKPRRLDGVLVYDIQRQAFTTHKIATGYKDEDTGDWIESDLPEVVSGLPVKEPFMSIKEYPVIATVDGTVYEVLDNDELKILADDPIDSEEFTYESSVLVCLDVANNKITFGDFRNNLLKDWTAGDWEGDGYEFESYLVSHPLNASSYTAFSGQRRSDIVHTKNMPYLISYFRRTETGELTTGEFIYPSACQGSILWDWRTSGAQGKWSSPTELYRPYKRTMFDQGYVITKTNIRGLGKAYQVKLESVGGSQFILESLVYDLKNDGRV